MSGTRIIAHRGASFDAPENTRIAAQLAWQQGADAVEIDCRLTGDGQVVVIHDRDTCRTSGESLIISQQSLTRIRRLDVGRWQGPEFAGERVPLLREIIETMPAAGRLFIEVKCGEEILPQLAEILDRAEIELDRFVIICFDSRIVAKIKARLAGVSAPLVARSAGKQTGAAAEATIAQLIERAGRLHLDGVDLDAAGQIDTVAVAALHAANLECCVWTVDDPLQARKLAAMGVDGITTNRPAWLREQLTAGLPTPEVG
jgi:glycerophosphoryl diester phosphodiesterase